LEVEIIKSGTGASEILADGIRMLAVTTSLNSKIFKQISRQELLSKPGLIIQNGKGDKWKCTESIEDQGKLIFPGPYYKGETLADTNLNIDLLLNLAVSFRTLIEKNIQLDSFYLSGIFIPENGGLILFPPILIDYVTEQLSDTESLSLYQPFNHPNAAGELQHSFTLGVLAYKLLTDELPFEGTSITEIREKMRRSQPVDIELLKPGLKKNLADLIKSSISLKDIKLENWIKQIELWKNDGPVDSITETERQQIQQSAELNKYKLQKQFKRKQFLTHNWKTIAAVIVSFVLIISFSIGPVKNALEPPVTVGMSPEEVVETYYRSIINMDTEIMEDCVKKGVGKSDIQEVTQLYVISKVRTGYEGTSGLISAQDWNDGVVTEINPGEQVYGIADLKLTGLENSSFQANYIRWYPNIPDDPDSRDILPPSKVYIKDLLTLEKTKDVWIIVNLERTSEAGR
jgi:hypothetical protein